MKKYIALIVVLLSLLLTSTASAETQAQMRARVISELKSQYSYMLSGCAQSCIDGYSQNGGDWLTPAAKFIGQPLNDVVLANIAWNAKKGDEFKRLIQSSYGREPTQAEWNSFWGNLTGYEWRNQGFLDLFNVSPRLDKDIGDNSFHRKQEFRGGLE